MLISMKSLMFTKSVYQHPLKYETWFTFFLRKIVFLSRSFCQLKKTGLLILLETYNFTHWSEHCWLHLKVHFDSSFLKIISFPALPLVEFILGVECIGLMVAEYLCFVRQFRVRKESIFT